MEIIWIKNRSSAYTARINHSLERGARGTIQEKMLLLNSRGRAQVYSVWLLWEGGDFCAVGLFF